MYTHVSTTFLLNIYNFRGCERFWGQNPLNDSVVFIIKKKKKE